MTKLTSEQKKFLDHHKISLSSVFDATGLGKSDYRKEMKLLDKSVAVGVTPCKKGRHSLRSRSGHCVQCNTASLAFQARNTATAYVYVAGSLSLKVIKVGMSANIENRFNSLNDLGYGGASDWTCLCWKNTENAGNIEFRVHSILNKYAAPTTYERFGNTVNCLETFSCDANLAINEIDKITNKNNDSWQLDELAPYQFTSLVGKEFVRAQVENKFSAAIPLNRSNKNDSTNETGLPKDDSSTSETEITQIAQSKTDEMEINKLQESNNTKPRMRWWHFLLIILLIQLLIGLAKIISK